MGMKPHNVGRVLKEGPGKLACHNKSLHKIKNQ